jgi:hypothetical protein
MYWLIQFKMIRHGSAYDERRFENKQQAHGEFYRIFGLPARDHVWEWLQLWEISDTGPAKLLDEKQGL